MSSWKLNFVDDKNQIDLTDKNDIKIGTLKLQKLESEKPDIFAVAEMDWNLYGNYIYSIFSKSVYKIFKQIIEKKEKSEYDSEDKVLRIIESSLAELFL